MGASMNNILEELKTDLNKTKSIQEIDLLKSKYLGKKSQLKQLADKIKDIPAAERPAYGVRMNELRTAMENLVVGAIVDLSIRLIQESIENEYCEILLSQRHFSDGPGGERTFKFDLRGNCTFEK